MFDRNLNSIFPIKFIAVARYSERFAWECKSLWHLNNLLIKQRDNYSITKFCFSSKIFGHIELIIIDSFYYLSGVFSVKFSMERLKKPISLYSEKPNLTRVSLNPKYICCCSKTKTMHFIAQRRRCILFYSLWCFEKIIFAFYQFSWYKKPDDWYIYIFMLSLSIVKIICDSLPAKNRWL